MRGGEETNITMGLNWYVNEQIRVTFNYIHADIDNDLNSGVSHIFQTRLQFDFLGKELGELRTTFPFSGTQ